MTTDLIDAARAARTLIYVLDAKPADRQWKANVLDALDAALLALGYPVVLTGLVSESDPPEDV